MCDRRGLGHGRWWRSYGGWRRRNGLTDIRRLRDGHGRRFWFRHRRRRRNDDGGWRPRRRRQNDARRHRRRCHRLDRRGRYGGGRLCRNCRRRLAFYWSRRRYGRTWWWRRRCGRLLLANGAQHIAGPGDVREVDLGLDVVRLPGWTLFGGGAPVRNRLEVRPHFDRLVFLDGTGVRFLLGDAHFQKNVEDRFAFYFQLPGQIVDSNLTHPPFSSSALSLKSSWQPQAVGFCSARHLQ